MNYVLITIYLLIAIGFFALALAYKSGKRKLNAGANIPKQDHLYWEQTTKKCMKGYFVATIGAAVTAGSIAFKSALPAEIGCIVLLSAVVFTLALICRKTDFRPCDETISLQNKCKGVFLAFSIAALILTQFVFQYFNNLLMQAK